MNPKETKDKKDFIKFGVVFLIVLCLPVLFVILVDPFYQYHKPIMDIPVILEDAVYQTPGAARNLEYRDAIVGTSMTENFHSSWFDEELGWNTAKLSYAGARSDDLKAILTQVFDGGQKAEHLFMDLNDYQLTVESWTAYADRPAYLYDGNPLNDARYLLNRDVFNKSTIRVLERLEGRESNMDTAYTWEDPALFGAEIAKATCKDRRNEILDGTFVRESTGDPLKICQDNLDNITPFMAEHPETEFLIILPPYSMLYWEQKVLANELDGIMEVYAYAIEQLLQYDNVKLYYFQDEFDIITDLDNYRDDCHHRPEYNRYMFECVRDGRKEMTKENYRELLQEMHRFAKEYDYSVNWKS